MMNRDSHKPISDDELETLLTDTDFAQPPEHFVQDVMESINALPNRQVIQPTWWQWLALLGGGIPAFMQTIAFVFSAWNIANLG